MEEEELKKRRSLKRRIGKRKRGFKLIKSLRNKTSAVEKDVGITVVSNEEVVPAICLHRNDGVWRCNSSNVLTEKHDSLPTNGRRKRTFKEISDHSLGSECIMFINSQLLIDMLSELGTCAVCYYEISVKHAIKEKRTCTFCGS